MIVALVVISILLAGCQEEQKSKVWGKGELPAPWRELFGKDNISRLNFAQTEASNRHQALIFGVNVKDPNGQPVRKRGLIERVKALEEQIEALEKLNSAQHKKIGETQIRFQERLLALEQTEPAETLEPRKSVTVDLVFNPETSTWEYKPLTKE